MNWSSGRLDPQSPVRFRIWTRKFGNRPLPHHLVKGPAEGHNQHDIPCDNAVWELSWLLPAIELGGSKIISLYSMFDSHRQVFSTVRGATWFLAIGKCACRVNVTFIVLFMRGCHVDRGPLCWRIYSYGNKDSVVACCFPVCFCSMWSMLSCFFSLRPQVTYSTGS
jgi:hypothetical protein